MKLNPSSLHTKTTAKAKKPTLPAKEAEAKSAPDSFTEAERKELDEWGDRLRSRLGVLETPPAGPVSKELKFAQSYLTELVEQLAGQDLKKQGVKLHVEVFSGDIPQAALDDNMYAEKKWKRKNPDTPWPIRAWLGAPQDGNKPIYRMAVNLGLLNALESRDELAFVLSHQTEKLLDHDRKDPDNLVQLKPSNKSFLRASVVQADLDRAAIERMKETGFNPRAALSALNKLFDKNPIDYPDDDLRRGLVGAAHGQEHQGMRIALVQTQVENLVRKADPSVSLDIQTLPEALKIKDAADYVRCVDNPEEFQADYKSLGLALSQGETPDWMFKDGEPPVEVSRIVAAKGTVGDQEEALVGLTEALRQDTSRSPQQKVDGFLRTLLAMEGRPLNGDGNFSAAGTAKLHSFLQTEGENWEPQTFLATLSKNGKSRHRDLVDSLLFKEPFQEVLKDALPGLVEAAPAAFITHNNGEQRLNDLVDMVEKNHAPSRRGWPLGDQLDQATLKFLGTLDGQALAQKTDESGANEAMVFTNTLLSSSKPSPKFQRQLQEATKPLLEASNSLREDQARLRLRLPLQNPSGLNDYLVELGTSADWSEFSPEFEMDFPRLLRDVVTMTAEQPDVIYGSKRPETYSHAVEKQIAKLATQGSGQPQQSAINHLARHLSPIERVKGRSPRREWLGEAAKALAKIDKDVLVKQLSFPDLGQHQNLIVQTLRDGYRLNVEDLPDASNKSLTALNTRVTNKEFEPQRKDYPNRETYVIARDDYKARQRAMSHTFDFVAPMESRLVLGKMALLGHNAEASQEFAQKLEVKDFVSILQGGEQAALRSELLTDVAGSKDSEYIGADPGAFIFDGLVAVQDKIENLQDWHALTIRSWDFSSGGLEARVGTRRKLAENLNQRLEKLEVPALEEWLSKDRVLDLLTPEMSSELLLKCIAEDCKPGGDTQRLSNLVKSLDATYKLAEEHPIAYAGLRDKVAELANLQPHNVDLVFPKIERGVTDSNKAYENRASALSGLLAVARERSPEEQIDTIEYLMGRQDKIPGYLEDASESQNLAPLAESLQTTRQNMAEADNQTRVLVANSFLAGPSGILRSDEGREAVINYFLKDLAPANRELGEQIARGVLASHGEADTLAVAFILGQKPEEPKDGQDPGKAGKLNEAKILNRLFDAYGVPGIKMKQYLAFTSEFGEFKEAFESAQDASMPLNYFQVLKLVQTRFGDEWPKDLEIDRVLGSGSVNVAIRYRNEATGKREVVALGREDIEESTAYDFDRFNKFIAELTKTPEDREKFGYVLGLLNLINSSVALEFDKESALNVQQTAFKTYKHEKNGWKVRSIDAYRVENLGLFMEEAKGKTARKIYTRNPEVYAQAMEAMSAAEFGVLKGQDSSKNWLPKTTFANPDFHDGQVLIDEDTKTATILDFGQALPISNAERKGGLDLLTIIGKADSPKRAAKRLNKRYFGKENVLTAEDLAPILERKDRMDCFIHLLSTLSRKGADVPLAAVHWILGINRQLALSEKIGKPIDKEVRNMVINHKVGLPLATYNAAHGTKVATVKAAKHAARAAVAIGASIAHVVGGWLGWNATEETENPAVEPSIFKSAGLAPESLETPPPKPQVLKRATSKYAWKPNVGQQRDPEPR